MTTHESARLCGCDPGAHWTCAEHRDPLPIASPVVLIPAAEARAMYAATPNPPQSLVQFASGLQIDDDD